MIATVIIALLGLRSAERTAARWRATRLGVQATRDFAVGAPISVDSVRIVEIPEELNSPSLLTVPHNERWHDSDPISVLRQALQASGQTPGVDEPLVSQRAIANGEVFAGSAVTTHVAAPGEVSLALRALGVPRGLLPGDRVLMAPAVGAHESSPIAASLLRVAAPRPDDAVIGANDSTLVEVAVNRDTFIEIAASGDLFTLGRVNEPAMKEPQDHITDQN